MTDREAMQQALEALRRIWDAGGLTNIEVWEHEAAMDNLYWALASAQPEQVIDKAAAIRIATALGWVPPGDTSQDCVDQAQKQRHEQEPVVKWDASAPLVVTPHPAFQATPPQGIYYTPPQRTWVGLTDEEIRFIAWGDFGVDQEKHLAEVLPLARAIEAKLRAKNT